MNTKSVSEIMMQMHDILNNERQDAKEHGASKLELLELVQHHTNVSDDFFNFLMKNMTPLQSMKLIAFTRRKEGGYYTSDNLHIDSLCVAKFSHLIHQDHGWVFIPSDATPETVLVSE